jgi:hypothetical protein
LALLIVATVALLGATVIPAAGASSPAGTATSSVKNPICQRLGQVGVSAGAHGYCQGPAQSSAQSGQSAARNASGSPSVPANVDAANPREDTTPAGLQAYGQAEQSVAAVGSYVVEAWNDSTGFFTNCGAPQFKEELTGYGFSANGGKSFRDEGGLPNSRCSSGWRLFGDPSVVGWSSGGVAYFYISSLYINLDTGQSDLALNTCQASGTGFSAVLACNGTPTVMAAGVPPTSSTTGDFLDKEFLTLDRGRGRLYASYTRFSNNPKLPEFNGRIELAVCDISGASAAHPTCSPGSSTSPYYIVQPANLNCENEGAYPAVNPANGDLYVAWEFNWATNFITPACYGTPTQNRIAYVPFSCLRLTPTSPCTSPARIQATVLIHSMDAAFIPGFNRNPAGPAPANDFPRIAVSDASNTVTIVWNDARRRPTGDILMQSYHLLSSSSTAFKPVQAKPVRLNNNTSATWKFMPALRNANKSGLLDIIWFDRRNSNTSCAACTDVYGALHVSPTATTPPTSNVRITNVSSNWDAASSDIIPNFGDYNDDLVVGNLLYIAWADGRLSDPQPFSAHMTG